MNTDSQITFASLQLAEPIQRALTEKNYTIPSPIQAMAIPALLQGKDLIGIAQTGTGKTAAFALPILHRLASNKIKPGPRQARVLILTPTRELAAQIEENINLYGKHLGLHHAVIFGGVGQNPQVKKLARGVDILVATPGRLLDLEGQRHLDLRAVEIFVLDEADRMLDMGFVHDVKKVLSKLPQRRQSLLFSATMPPAIRELAGSFLHHPEQVEVAPVATTAERIEQQVCMVDKSKKRDLLIHFLRKHTEGLVLVFSRTKHGANRLAEQLDGAGIRAEAIHGNKSQGARTRALENFRAGKTRVLVATDIAARGIDVKGIALVINFEIPDEPESYVHRIGRTARAGAEGLAISFCEHSERRNLRDIEKLIRMNILVVKDHPFASAASSSNDGGNGEPRQARVRIEPRMDGRPMQRKPAGRSWFGFGGGRQQQGGGQSRHSNSR